MKHTHRLVRIRSYKKKASRSEKDVLIKGSDKWKF